MRILAATCCLVLTACSAPQGTPPPQAASSPSASDVPSPAPSVSPGPEPKPKLTAKDGTDFKACVDARCQVLLKKEVEFTPSGKFGVVRLFLTHKSPNRLEFLVIRRNVNDVQGYLTGTGYLSLAESMTIKVEQHDRGGAILRFEPKAVDRKADKASGSEGLSIYG